MIPIWNACGSTRHYGRPVRQLRLEPPWSDVITRDVIGKVFPVHRRPAPCSNVLAKSCEGECHEVLVYWLVNVPAAVGRDVLRLMVPRWGDKRALRGREPWRPGNR